MTPKRLRNPAGRSAFTLVELLVVIGIIIILVGILLPVIAHMRIAVYKADTQNELDQISSACNQYYTTFNAYPGPFSNDEIEQNSPATPNPNMVIEFPMGAAASRSQWFVTGAENLVVGLMGGMHWDATNNIMAFVPQEVGLGPPNLSSSGASPGRTPAFFPNGSTYLIWCEGVPGSGRLGGMSNVIQSSTYQPNLTPTSFTDQAGIRAAPDSIIPEFGDRFPTPGPMPILYLRARTGAKGVVSFFGATNYGQPLVTDPTTTLNAQYQYDIGDIIAYVNTNIGLPTGDIHNLNGLGPTTWPLASPNAPQGSSPVVKAGAANPKTTTNLPDAFNYFINASITPTDITNPNPTGRPRAVDQFILISAGPDGIYGTSDDITSFGDVSQ